MNDDNEGFSMDREEDDCEDQGFGTIADGCTYCATWVCGTRYPHPLVPVAGFWVCEGCSGSYGPAEPNK